jgi:hypothetical protein
VLLCDVWVGSNSLGSGHSFTWVLAGDAVFGIRPDSSGSSSGGGSSGGGSSGGGSSSSLKKRFSFFNKDAVSGKDDFAEHHQEASRDAAEATDDGLGNITGRGGGRGGTEWFDIGMSFCSEMDLPMRDDIDAEIVSEAQKMMREEGR